MTDDVPKFCFGKPADWIKTPQDGFIESLQKEIEELKKQLDDATIRATHLRDDWLEARAKLTRAIQYIKDHAGKVTAITMVNKFIKGLEK
jgi:molecular chaperone GrpE (heat shock protein)